MSANPVPAAARPLHNQRPYHHQVFVYADASSDPNPGPSVIAFQIYDIFGNLLCEDSYQIGHHTIVEAEYTAVLKGLLEAHRYTCKSAIVVSDNQTVIKQLQKKFRILKSTIDPYFQACQRGINFFENVEFRLLKECPPTDKVRHQKADRLSKQRCSNFLNVRNILQG